MLVGVNDPKCGVYPQYDLFDKEMTFVMRGTSKELAKHVKSVTVTPLSDYHVQRYLVRVRDFKNKSASLSFQAFSSSCNTDILTGKSAVDNVDIDF